MIDAGIFDGDLVVVREQPDAENGDVVVAGIPGDEATVKRSPAAAVRSFSSRPTSGSSRWS